MIITTSFQDKLIILDHRTRNTPQIVVPDGFKIPDPQNLVDSLMALFDSDRRINIELLKLPIPSPQPGVGLALIRPTTLTYQQQFGEGVVGNLIVEHKTVKIEDAKEKAESDPVETEGKNTRNIHFHIASITEHCPIAIEFMGYVSTHFRAMLGIKEQEEE